MPLVKLCLYNCNIYLHINAPYRYILCYFPYKDDIAKKHRIWLRNPPRFRDPLRHSTPYRIGPLNKTINIKTNKNATKICLTIGLEKMPTVIGMNCNISALSPTLHENPRSNVNKSTKIVLGNRELLTLEEPQFFFYSIIHIN